MQHATALLRADHKLVSGLFAEYVEHHVKEEQNEMFPNAKATRLDMHELGAQSATRKAESLAERDGS